MGIECDRRHGFPAGQRDRVNQRGCGHADQHILALEFRGVFAVRVDVMKRVHPERGRVIRVSVQLRIEPVGRVRAQLDTAERDVLVRLDHDVLGVHVQAFRREHQAERRVVLIAELEHERFDQAVAVAADRLVQHAGRGMLGEQGKRGLGLRKLRYTSAQYAGNVVRPAVRSRR